MSTNPHAIDPPQAGDTTLPRLLTLCDVTAMTALSRSAVYALMSNRRHGNKREMTRGCLKECGMEL